MKPKRLLTLILLFLIPCLAFFPASVHAITYPADSDFLWGNGAVNAPAQTSFVSGTGLPYRLLLPPNYTASIKYPVVIFLHGSGQVGSNNTSQLFNNANGAKTFVSTAGPNNRDTYPCIFICPQTNNDWKFEAGRMKQLIDTIKTNYSVDDDRVALTGYSLGALGSWPIVRNNPDTFSCLVTISGGGNGGDTQNMQPLPVWLFHSETDTDVACNYSDQTVGTLRSRGIPVIYTRYTDGKHGINTTSFQLPQLVPWVFAQRRGAPMAGVPTISVSSMSLGTSPLTVTGSTNMGTGITVKQVGWCRSNIGGTISGTDGNFTDGTFVFSSPGANFTSVDLTDYRIAIRHDVKGVRTGYVYDVDAVTSATTLTTDRKIVTGTDSAPFPYSLYKRGGNSNLNPEPGTTTNNWATWSISVPVVSGSQTVQVIAEASIDSSTWGGRTTYNIPLGVSYATPTGDTAAPTLSVSTPATPYITTSSTVTLSGSAFDNVGVTAVNWTTDRGFSGTVAGPFSAWTILNLPLKPGMNNITVYATDAKNNRATVFRQVTYNSSANTDSTSPIVTIVSPTTAPTYVTTNITIDLSGTASDNVGVTGVLWKNVTASMNGPATGTTSWTASAIPLLSGTNVLVVTGSDAAGNIGSGTITVIRNQPVNQAPTVNAGPDKAVTLPATGSFSGTATDDGLPSGTLTYAWSKVSGPGAVSFSTPSAASTTATFGADGIYELRLTASDGTLSSADEVTVTVSPAPQGSGQKLRFDFGVSTQTTSTTGWNNLAGTGTTTSVSNCVDSSGAATGVGLSITQAFSNMSDNGVTSPSTPYPQTAMRDFISAQNATGKLKFTGLDPTASYKVTFYGFKLNPVPSTDRTGLYRIGTAVVELDAANNRTNTVNIPAVSPAADGTLEITVSPKAGSNYAYLNVLEIEKNEPVAPLYFDIGVSTQTTTLPGWNNLVGTGTTTSVSNCVDSTGATTGIGLSITQAFANTSDNGVTSPANPYPQTAMRDFISAQNTAGKLKFTGLNAAARYKVTIYAYKRNPTPTGDRVGKYTVGGEEPQTLDAENNLDKTIIFDATPAADGTLEVIADFDAESNSLYSYLSVLVLQRE